MKNTSIHTYSAATSLIAFLVSFIATQDAAIACATFATAMTAWIVVYDYSPRSYFVITSKSIAQKVARTPASAFAPCLGPNLRKAKSREVSLSA